MHKARSAQTPTASPPSPRSTRATTSAPAARSTSAPSRAIPTRAKGEKHRLPRRLPDGLRPEDRQDDGLSHSRAAPRHHQHHARRIARRRLHLHLLRRSPGPASSPFMILDLKTGKYRDLMDTQHMLRASSSSITSAGRITRSSAATSPATTRRPTSSNGSSRPSTASRRRRSRTWPIDDSHPINWDISPDGKTLYCGADERQPALLLRPHRQRRTPRRSESVCVRPRRRPIAARSVRRAEGRLGGRDRDVRNNRRFAHLVSYKPVMPRRPIKGRSRSRILTSRCSPTAGATVPVA